MSDDERGTDQFSCAEGLWKATHAMYVRLEEQILHTTALVVTPTRLAWVCEAVAAEQDPRRHK